MSLLSDYDAWKLDYPPYYDNADEVCEDCEPGCEGDCNCCCHSDYKRKEEECSDELADAED